MGNKRELFLKKIASGKNFALRFDLVDRWNGRVFHFGIAEKLLSFLRIAGIKFFELGNLSAVDHASFKPISIFAKEPQLIADEMFEKIGFKGDRTNPRSSLVNAAVQHCIDHKDHKLLSSFVEFEQRNNYWLQNYALFMALSKHIGTNEFCSWPEGIGNCERKLLGVASKQLFDKIIFEKTTQFLTHLSLKNFTERANQLGISVGGTVNVLCEEFSSEVWGNQRLFFLNKLNRATVYNGLPANKYLEHGLKSSQVPYRWNEMYGNNYELIHNFFRSQEEAFDYAHLLNSHTIFHYWEIPSFETNGEHGRWVPTKSELFFEYTKPHFDQFPFIFDFNDPLSPKHALLARRHNLLRAVVQGEPETHTYEKYDLSAKIKILASRRCNGKFPLGKALIQSILSEAKTNLASMIGKNFPIKLIHIEEVCSILGVSIADIANNPEYYGEIFGNILAEKPASAKKPHKPVNFPSEKEKKSILQFITALFSKK
ncbi:MAG: 4-alpha-glucanotransferase [Puniceicoccales bacterium]|nr:4-alpha-glucanotransferase [Puniceicoccales bacterium]